MHKRAAAFLAALLALGLAAPSLACASGGVHLDGGALTVWWVLPFACMLLSIALLPLVLPSLWHHHYGKIAVFWGLCFLVPCAVQFGAGLALYELQHTIILEYIPFLILLFALFTISGGVRVAGDVEGSPAVNTGILAIGTLLASLMGTTGASMLLIRPLLRANQDRAYKIHTVVFFIFLVSNIGGSLTPLGDPPLFLGFLKGVDFFWTTRHMTHIMLFNSAILLALYYVVEKRLLKKEGRVKAPEAMREPIRIEGGLNLLLLCGVVGAVLMSGLWNPGVDFPVGQMRVAVQDMARDGILLALAGVSWLATPRQTRLDNEFSWDPIVEVGKLFFGIFVSMIPAIAVLKAGQNGALSPVISLVSHEGAPVNHMYFWLSGILSSFLDNAPTYLVFFNTAGGDAQVLMNQLPATLAAISCGSVFMGANSYIGNAPNFMVRSIAESQGVKMPSFFGYMAWSSGILVPLFVVDTFLFFL